MTQYLVTGRKICSTCKEELPLSEFGQQWNKARQKHYPSASCKPCMRDKQRVRYITSPIRKRTQTEAARERYRQAGEIMYEAKAVPCADCGGKFPPYVMDFDHVRGKKLFNIGEARSRPIQVILDEIAKCDVVCSNCHRIRTHERKQQDLQEVS